MWIVHLKSGQSQLSDVDPPNDPSVGRILVRVESSSLNGSDARERQLSSNRCTVSGLEFAGTVISKGAGVASPKVGDRVMGLRRGGHAEVIDVSASCSIPIPAWMSWEQAGAFSEIFATAHDALVTNAGMKAGDRVLVHGAAGGVGVAAVQIAALMGGHIVASVRDPNLRASVEDLYLGSIAAVDPEQAWDLGPFDVILELVGASNLRHNVDSLAPGGRIVVVGVGHDESAVVNLRTIMHRRAVLTGSTMKHRSEEERGAALQRAADDILPAVRDGVVRIPVEGVFAFTDVEEAFLRFDAGNKFGKLVLLAEMSDHADTS